MKSQALHRYLAVTVFPLMCALVNNDEIGFQARSTESMPRNESALVNTVSRC